MEILLPKNLNCIACNIHISVNNKFSLCKSCYDSLENDIHICAKCGRIIGSFNVCFECDRENYFFDGVYSKFIYNDILHNLIYKYKYGHGTFLVEYFADMIIEKIVSIDIMIEGLTYVPLSNKRYNHRGFNQSELLARIVGKKLNYPVYSTVRRVKDTKYLSKLSGVQRLLEVKDIFDADRDFPVGEIKKILLIDDIFTSGATTNEIAKVLKGDLKVEKVFVLTLANARVRR